MHPFSNIMTTAKDSGNQPRLRCVRPLSYVDHGSEGVCGRKEVESGFPEESQETQRENG